MAALIALSARGPFAAGAFAGIIGVVIVAIHADSQARATRQAAAIRGSLLAPRRADARSKGHGWR